MTGARTGVAHLPLHYGAARPGSRDCSCGALVQEGNQSSSPSLAAYAAASDRRESPSLSRIWVT